jgi:hypothetical protein
VTAALTTGQTVNGYVEENAWNYYNYVTSSMNALTITISQRTADADCDVFVRRGQLPTRFSFDYSDLSQSQTTVVSIPDPGQATWYIGVFGWSDVCIYNITATTSSESICYLSTSAPAGRPS